GRSARERRTVMSGSPGRGGACSLRAKPRIDGAVSASAVDTLQASRAISSAGRAPPRQGGGHWFEPSIAHRIRPRVYWAFAFSGLLAEGAQGSFSHMSPPDVALSIGLEGRPVAPGWACGGPVEALHSRPDGATPLSRTAAETSRASANR